MVFKLVTIASVIVFLLSSCRGEPELEFNGPGEIRSEGTIDIPTDINQSGWKIASGFNSGKISGGSYEIFLNQDAVQLVMVMNADSVPVLMAVDVTSSQSSEKKISAASTAEAIVFLNPFFCTSDMEEARELKQRILSLPSFENLTSVISLQLQNGSFSFAESNSDLISALRLVFNDMLISLGLDEFDKSALLKSSEDYRLSPDGEVNGLKIEELSQTPTSLSFKIANRAKRWISIYVDKSTDGINFVSSSAPVDLIPSTEASLWNLVTQHSILPPSYSVPIQTDLSGQQAVSVKCYGLGIYHLTREIDDIEFKRIIWPASISIVFDLALPCFEVISGFPLKYGDLRSGNWNDPVSELGKKVMQDILKTEIKQALTSYFHEQDIPKAVFEIIKVTFNTCAREPVLVWQILRNKIGENAVRGFMNNILWPIKVINVSFTAFNLGYALASTLGTEAVTDFRYENSTTTYPVTVRGCVKDYNYDVALRNAIAGATITSYDINGNYLQSAVSDATGYYDLSSNTGYLKIRVVASGYKPINQVIQIPEDILIQNPPVFFAPISWLSKYSSEAGDVDGIVVDATNLNPVPGVSIILRAGVNDISRDAIQQQVSAANGSFSFTAIPSGTYTAFFSKDGYIDDILVLSVLGGQSTSGFEMNLSPDIHTSSGYRIILTWGEDPRDLDSHLFTPGISGTTYHIYYRNQGSLTYIPYAYLDVDDVNSYGPETVTIANTYPGEYYYSIYHYAGDGSLSTTSAATVSLYGTEGFLRSWSVPSSGNGLWWNVFSIDGATGRVTNINQISSSPPIGYKGLAESDMKAK